jgi:hypothetical protein
MVAIGAFVSDLFAESDPAPSSGVGLGLDLAFSSPLAVRDPSCFPSSEDPESDFEFDFLSEASVS